MKHDELLMLLWDKRNSLCDNLDIHFALTAVVELHSDDYGMCMTCEMKDYPCQTIQIIEKQLI
jgi:hypothetical protein